MLEYLLENSEYDVGERLVDSLENSSENSLGKENQHTDVLIVEETSE